MLGIPTGVFNEAGGLVKDWLKNPLNASFFYWYFLPAAGLVLLQLVLIGPVLGVSAPGLFNIDTSPPKSTADLILQILNARVFALIILPLLMGIVLSSISGTILRLFQGTLLITRALFRGRLEANRKRSEKLYGPLPKLRHEYLLLVSGAAEPESVALIEKLQKEIHALHDELESATTERELPVDPERVGPSRLANTLAVAEEYPFERYGMDAAVFWPRVSAEIAPQKLESLTASFGAMNGLLNLSLLSCLVAIEFLIAGIAISTGWIQPLPPHRWLFAAIAIGSAGISVLVALALYRAAVGVARSVANAMRTAFDYYRGDVLRRFNLKMPDDIDEERQMWLRLAAFIRRGEPFYYPSECRLHGKD
jgi:hypothetical protein